VCIGLDNWVFAFVVVRLIVLNVGILLLNLFNFMTYKIINRTSFDIKTDFLFKTVSL